MADDGPAHIGDITFISSSLYGSVAEINAIYAGTGFIADHTADNTADTFGLTTIDITVEGTPTAEEIRTITAIQLELSQPPYLIPKLWPIYWLLILDLMKLVTLLQDMVHLLLLMMPSFNQLI